MKAQISGTHYYLYLDENNNEKTKLKEGSLEANLQDEEGENLGKKIILSLNKETSTSEVNYGPEDPPKIIQVVLSFSDYLKLTMENFYILRNGIFSYQIEETDTSNLL